MREKYLGNICSENGWTDNFFVFLCFSQHDLIAQYTEFKTYPTSSSCFSQKFQQIFEKFCIKAVVFVDQPEVEFLNLDQNWANTCPFENIIFKESGIFYGVWEFSHNYYVGFIYFFPLGLYFSLHRIWHRYTHTFEHFWK